MAKSILAVASLLAFLALPCPSLHADTDIGRLLVASGWTQGTRANCLFVGAGAPQAAVDAGRLPEVRAYVVAEGGDALHQARLDADRAGVDGSSVWVRQGSLNDIPFPDCFFHRVIVWGEADVTSGKELLRVTRPGGKILLGPPVGGPKVPGVKEETFPGEAFPNWRQCTRPVVGAEWPMKGGTFYGDTIRLSYWSPDEVIRPPLRLLWVSRLPEPGGTGGGTIVSGGRIYFVAAYEQTAKRFMLDAYTGEVLRRDLPPNIAGVWKDLIFVMKGRDERKQRGGTLTALDRDTFAEKWTGEPGWEFLGVRADQVLCQKGTDKVAYLDAGTGRKLKEGAPEQGDVVPPRWDPYCITPDGSVCSKKGHDQAFAFAPKGGGKAITWQVHTHSHDCGAPVIANGYVWAELGYPGVAAFPLGLPSGEQMKQRAWYHVWRAYNCYNPVVAYGNLYTGDTRSHLACFASGEADSRQDEPAATAVERGDPPPAGPAQVNYNPGDWPMFHCNPARTGSSPDQQIQTPLKVVWSSQAAKGPICSSPAVADGTVYVGSNDGKIYALDAANGRVRWSFPTEGEVHCSPCVWGGMVFCGSDDGWIYCLNADTGRLIWRRAADHRPTETVSLSGDLIAGFPVDFPLPREYGASQQCVSRFSIEGVPKPGPWVVRGSPMVVDGRLYVGSGLGSPPSFWGYLYCIDPRRGEILWKHKASRDKTFSFNSIGSSGVDFAPAYTRGRIYVLGYELEVLDAETGADEGFVVGPYRRKYSTAPSSGIAVADDRAFIATLVSPLQETVCSVSLLSGSIIGMGKRTPRGTCPTLAEGMAYCPGDDGIDVYPAQGYQPPGDLVGAYPVLRTVRQIKCTQACADFSSPAYANGLLFCVTGNAKSSIEVFEGPTGRRLQAVELPAAVHSSPAVARGRLFVGADDGRVYCLSAQ